MNKEKIVCLIISNFILVILLSCIIALYNLVPLTPIATKHGIAIIFCNNIVVVAKIIPFLVPNPTINAEIVYPKQKPLNPIIK